MAQKLKFSPSHSAKWMNCPGSLALCATLPPQEYSKFAAEGTAAHEVAAFCLENGQEACEWVGEEIEVDERIFKVTEAMADHIQVYIDAVRGDMKENGVVQADLAVEEKFKIQLGTELVSGTNDASFSSPFGKMYVYDLKFGVGTYVEVVENTQLMLYALGAMDAAEWINEEVEIVIAQPRYTREDVPAVRRWSITSDELKVFKVLVMDALVACKKKGAKCIPGDWCKKSFCQAQGICLAVKEKALAVTGGMQPPATLTPDVVALVLENADLVYGWVKAVKDHAQRQAIDLGVVPTGYKLIQKKGNRAWMDDLLVENEFEHELGDKIYDKKVKSPAKIEKMVGKDRVAPLVSRPDKGMELVRESAKGDAVNPGGVFKKLKKEK